MMPLQDRILGCLLGGMIGDAMGAPGEGKTYQEIAQTYGELIDFEGAGTDDTAIRLTIIEAILASSGHPRVDDLAAALLKADASYRLWWVPVRNLFHKLQADVVTPADAGWGNMHSSSSAMAIAPLGILNAGDPRRAARETYELASLFHAGPTGFARDAACAMAAAVAAAFVPGMTVEEVLEAATAYLLPVSARVMREAIAATLDLAAAAGSYQQFRTAFYERYLREIVADPRETVPVALALFRLAGGDPTRAIILGANFGRDADTIATMVGGLAGAFRGTSALPPAWIEKAEAGAGARYRQLVDDLLAILARRRDEARAHAALLDTLLQPAVQGNATQ
jgi:ADP-ribosylglycohydrolase